MNKLKLISAMTLTSLLAACGGSGDADRQTPDIDIPTAEPTIAPPEYRIPTTQAHIPFLEDFNGASDTAAFFDAAYKELGGDYPGEDEFFFSTAGVFDSEGNLDPSGGNWITADSDQSFRLGNARFSMAQIAPLEGDARTKTTVENETILRGEMDLSQPYRLSFCVVDSSGASSGSSGFELYVDNNSSGKSAESIHGASSRVLKLSTNQFIAGKRAEINIPGDTILDGAGTVVSTGTINPGLDTSFLQIRVSSGGYIVIDDMVIEYQSDTSLGDAQTGCDTKTTDYATENPWVDALPTAEPTVEPSVEPTVEPTIPPAPTPEVDVSSAVFTSFNGKKQPTEVGSINTGASLVEFDEGNDSFPIADYWTAVEGIGTLDTEADKDIKTYADYGPIVEESFPKAFTVAARLANFKTLDKSFEIEMAFSGDDGSGNAARIKMMLRDDQVQFDKFDSATKPAWDFPEGFDVTKYHDYQLQVRMESVLSGSIWLYVDGELVMTASSANMSTTSADRNEIRIGENSSSPFHALVDWIVWTGSDGYSADDLVDSLPDDDLGDTSGYESTAGGDPIPFNVYNGVLAPLSDDSITLTDDTKDKFGGSSQSPADADFFVANADTDGTVTFDTTVNGIDGDTMLAKYNLPKVAVAADYPRYFTAVIRAKGNGSNKAIELDIALADAEQNGARIKSILHGGNGGLQLEKWDGTLKPDAYHDTYDDYRIYQVAITLDSATTGNVKIYEAGNDVAVIEVATTDAGGVSPSFLTSSSAYIRIGDGGGSQYVADVDWLIWTDAGAYTPSELNGKLPSGLGVTTGY